jgi:hypothetical protein
MIAVGTIVRPANEGRYTPVGKLRVDEFEPNAGAWLTGLRCKQDSQGKVETG